VTFDVIMLLIGVVLVISFAPVPFVAGTALALVWFIYVLVRQQHANVVKLAEMVSGLATLMEEGLEEEETDDSA